MMVGYVCGLPKSRISNFLCISVNILPKGDHHMANIDYFRNFPTISDESREYRRTTCARASQNAVRSVSATEDTARHWARDAAL